MANIPLMLNGFLDRETKAVAAQLLRGKTVAEMPLRRNDRFQVSISDTECAARGLVIPAEVRARLTGAAHAMPTAARSASTLS